MFSERFGAATLDAARVVGLGSATFVAVHAHAVAGIHQPRLASRGPSTGPKRDPFISAQCIRANRCLRPARRPIWVFQSAVLVMTRCRPRSVLSSSYPDFQERPLFMSRFKDACLNGRYTGSNQEIGQHFFEVINEATTSYRLLLTDLSREAAVLASTGIAKLIATGKEIRVLVALPQAPTNGAAHPTSKFAANEHSVKTIAESFGLSPPLQEDNALGKLSIRWCEISLQEKNELPRVAGFATDQRGDVVAFDAQIEPLDPNPKPKIIFSVGWTWGDPLARVKKALTQFDNLWERSATPLADFGSATNFALPWLLTELDRNPGKAILGSTSIKLFKHQETAVAAWLSRDGKGVFRMCTGAGKTVSALAAIRELAHQKSARGETIPPVIISVPTRILADQWTREIRGFGFKFTLGAYNSFDQWSQVLEPALRNNTNSQPRFVITTYRTIADERFVAKLRRANENGVKAIWVADEMHNLASTRLKEMMKQLSGVFHYRLGLSATPEIEGDLATTQWLLSYFGEICASYDLEDGIRDGVLCPYRYHPVPAYLAPNVGAAYLRLLQNIQVAHAQAGSSSLMSLYRDARELLRNSGVQIAAFRDLLKLLMHGSGLSHTLVYCPPGYGTYGNEQSDTIDADPSERRLIADVIDTLREQGLSASSILGETSFEERNEILTRFADGRVNALCAIGCLDEGVDVPSINRAIILYSVDREKQFIQRRGRILRQPKGVRGKTAEIFDILILPQGSSMPGSQARALLDRELRRYRKFAELALNRDEADRTLNAALEHATRNAA